MVSSCTATHLLPSQGSPSQGSLPLEAQSWCYPAWRNRLALAASPPAHVAGGGAARAAVAKPQTSERSRLFLPSPRLFCETALRARWAISLERGFRGRRALLEIMQNRPALEREATWISPIRHGLVQPCGLMKQIKRRKLSAYFCVVRAPVHGAPRHVLVEIDSFLIW